MTCFRPRLPLLLAVLSSVLGGPVLAQAGAAPDSLRLARIFSDGVVLQRGTPLPVWGWAPPGTRVDVAFRGASRQATAAADGSWSVRLPAGGAGGPFELRVSGAGRRVSVRDVLVGEVWLASGQSNMEFALSAATNGKLAVAAANDPELRMFTVPNTWSVTPRAELEGGSWEKADPQHAGHFSAVAYFFARDLRAAEGVPVGIVHSSWGGSNVETWESPRALGVPDSTAGAVLRRERENLQRTADSLRARLGDLPRGDEAARGDAWADPALDDSGWSALPVPSLWENAGLPGLDGTVWYRTRLELSEAEARRDAQLSLGMIDDDDVTWVNGVEVGRTRGYNQPRSYRVPASALRAGVNVVAVRVVDGGGGGGPYGSPGDFHLATAESRHALAGPWKVRVAALSLSMDGQRINKIPSALYNAMIHPLLRFPVRGVIWYQGESNANGVEQAAAYDPLFRSLIRGWRAEWKAGSPEFPFLWVQLPNYGAVDSVPPARSAWATLRESQSAALRLPATGQAVAIDVGEAGDIHPKEKQVVGERLALVARRVAYGESVEASGPTYRGHTVREGRLVIDFDHVDGGLVSPGPGDELHEFAVAGADRRWVRARARIEGHQVVVWSPDVPQPVAVRYAWSNSPDDPDLYNRRGLPARPFRSDAW